MTTTQVLDLFSQLPASSKSKFTFGLAFVHDVLTSASSSAAKPTVAPKRRADLPESTDNLTLPANTDQQKVADCRAALVKEIWQADNDGFVDLSPQLVDRIVYAVVMKMTGWKRVLRQIKRAKNRVDEYKNTDGKKGVETLWMALGKWCKELYASNGVAWIPVAGGQQEPEPACAQATAKPIVKLPSDEEEEQYPETTEEERAKLKAFEDRMRARYAKEHAHKEQEEEPTEDNLNQPYTPISEVFREYRRGHKKAQPQEA